MTDIEPPGGAAASARNRERALAEAFVALADTLVDDYDLVDLLDQLVNTCVDLLAVTAAGLLLDDERGNLAVVACSSEETRLLEVFVLQNNEGPCLDCLRTGTAISTGDLEDERERWHRFVPAAISAGFRSVTAVPLRLRDQTIGGLSLFRSSPDRMPTQDRALAQALADVATIGILQQRSVHRGALLSEQLQHALHSRVSIEQAKGVLAERNQIDMSAAFDWLRAYARNHNVKLTELATAVVRGEIDPTALRR